MPSVGRTATINANMMDTQWPRYMVFQQHEPGKQFVHNGTVHAADDEMALQTARDVFSRRPRAVQMWVVPADDIYSLTRQELTKVQGEHVKKESDEEEFHVFAKISEQGQCEHFGVVIASTHESAMMLATETFASKKALWWWVFPAAAVVSTQEDDVGSMFDPVLDKHYREQAQYPVVTMMRDLRGKGIGGNKDG